MRAYRVSHTPHGPVRPVDFEVDQNVRVPRDHTVLDYPVEHEQVEPHYTEPVISKPAPVYLVEAPPRDRRYIKGSCDSYTIDPTVTARTTVGAADRMRVRLRVRNSDTTNSVFMTFDSSSVNTTNGYEIPAGSYEDVYSNDAVYLYCLSGKTARVSVFRETELSDS